MSFSIVKYEYFFSIHRRYMYNITGNIVHVFATWYCSIIPAGYRLTGEYVARDDAFYLCSRDQGTMRKVDVVLLYRNENQQNDTGIYFLPGKAADRRRTSCQVNIYLVCHTYSTRYMIPGMRDKKEGNYRGEEAKTLVATACPAGR